jgi:hypothetical protein
VTMSVRDESDTSRPDWCANRMMTARRKLPPDGGEGSAGLTGKANGKHGFSGRGREQQLCLEPRTQRATDLLVLLPS